MKYKEYMGPPLWSRGSVFLATGHRPRSLSFVYIYLLIYIYISKYGVWKPGNSLLVRTVCLTVRDSNPEHKEYEEAILSTYL
jgi:hypothetical protein